MFARRALRLRGVAGRRLSSDLHMREGYVFGAPGAKPAARDAADVVSDTAEFLVLGGERPGRVARHNLGVAACGVVAGGVNVWGNPSVAMLHAHRQGKMEVKATCGPKVTMDDDEGLRALREVLGDGTDLYAVFGGLGSYGATSLPVAFVTDSPDAALCATYLLHRMPEGARHKVPMGPIHVMHSARISGLTTLAYEDADSRANIGIGADSSVEQLQKALAQAAGDLAPEGSLFVPGVALAEKEGSTLVVGTERSVTKDFLASGKLYGSGGVLVQSAGVSACFASALLTDATGADGELALHEGGALSKLQSANLAYFPTKVGFWGAEGEVDGGAKFEEMTNAADAALYKKLLGGVPAVGVTSAADVV